VLQDSSFRFEELEVPELIVLGSLVERDECEAGGMCPGGEVGVHPEFGAGGAAGDGDGG